jgi:succinate dehydrogenase flavin-adding protein (antitoxin of CptAB toxin-antitoxin module)
MSPIRIYPILLVLLLAGCAQSQKWETFSDDKFTMQYPKGLAFSNQDSTEIFREEYSPGDGSACSFVVEKKVNQPSLQSFVETLKGFFASKSATITNESDSVNMVDFHTSMTDNLTNKMYEGRIRLLACGDSTIYVMLASCEKDAYNKNKEIFEQVVNSAQCKS